jgi:DNA polymerase-1
MAGSSKTLLLIDGNNLFYRAYHALPPLTDKTGENANAVYGFSNMLIRATKEIEPAYVACAFDTKAPTFRHVEFEAYKAQRKPPPDDLYPQLPKVKSVLDAFGVKYFEKAGYEADDLLGTLAMQNLKNVDLVVILSGDRDVLQLVDGKIKVQMPSYAKASEGKPGWGVLMGSEEVKEKFGITPLQMIDYKAMTGDPSDNIPGVAGIGSKTAAALLQKYQTLEGIYEHIDEISGTTKDKLVKDKEIALAAKKLVKLDCDVKIEFRIENLEFKPDWDKVILELEKLGFKSIVSKLQGKIFNNEKTSNDSSESKDQLELI